MTYSKQLSPLIMIVDDEWMNRELLETVLQTADFRVTSTSNGERALTLIADDPPDLVLLDVRMPGIDGYEVCRRLRADPDTARLPIIMITGLESDSERSEAYAAGANDMVSRLLPIGELIERVQAQLT